MTQPNKALVTGGGSGIGLAVAAALIEAGWQVLIVGRSADTLRKAAAALGPQAEWHAADVSRREDAERAVGAAGDLVALINAAGFALGVSLASEPGEAETSFDAVVATNLKGAFLMAHAAAPRLKSPGGRIVNVSSIAAQTGGSRAGSLAYAAAKAGVHGLTFALARELAPRGITANAIAPGFIADTGFTGAWPRERVDAIVAETPLARAGRARDVAGAVRWLVSDDAGFVTGTVVAVNGGWRIG
jgi:3-oxoacyl-[acyl-carrier protein] reductase